MNTKKFETRTIGYLCADAVILLAFLLLKWIRIYTWSYSLGDTLHTSALLLPFQIKALDQGLSSFLGQSLTQYIVPVYIYAAIPYVILAGLVIAGCMLFLRHDQTAFCRWSWIWFIVDAVVAALYRPVILMICDAMMGDLSSLVGEESDVFGGIFATVLRNGAGLKVILIVSLIGIFAGVIIQFLNKKNVAIPAAAMEFDVRGLKDPDWVRKVHFAADKRARADAAEKKADAAQKEETSPQTQKTPLTLKLEGDGITLRIMKFPAVIGSDEGKASYDIPDSSISSEHCRLEKIGEKISISDLDSKKGTYIGEDRLPEGKSFFLMDGDVIRLGNIELTVSIENEK